MLLTGQLAEAQEARPFATPRYWLNSTTDDRLPIVERQLTFIDGIAGPRVPAPKRSGWTPRLSFGIESRDGNSGVGATDTIATLTPGLSYSKTTERLAYGGDLTFDAAQHYDQESFSDAVSALSADAQLIYAISPTSRLSAFASYSRLRDTGDAVVTGFLPVNAQLSARTATVAWSQEFSPRDRLEMLYSNSHQASDQPGQPDINTNSASVLFGHFLSDRDLIEGVAYFDTIAFEGGTRENVGAAYARYTRDLSDRFTVRGELGVLSTTAQGGRDFAKVGGKLTYTEMNAKLELELGRDIIAVPGLGTLIETEQIRASAHIRLDQGLQLQASAERQFLTGLGAPIDAQITSVDMGLSYALSRNLWLWGKVKASREASSGTRTNDTRVSFGLSRSFN